MTSREDRAVHRQRVDELLEQIDAQRRQRLLLEAAGMQAPGLEREAERARQQLADLVSG
jgi:L-2-hydroxyglutarate oxidase LhgO